jgi:hypothetical protein
MAMNAAFAEAKRAEEAVNRHGEKPNASHANWTSVI